MDYFGQVTINWLLNWQLRTQFSFFLQINYSHFATILHCLREIERYGLWILIYVNHTNEIGLKFEISTHRKYYPNTILLYSTAIYKSNKSVTCVKLCSVCTLSAVLSLSLLHSRSSPLSLCVNSQLSPFISHSKVALLSHVRQPLEQRQPVVATRWSSSQFADHLPRHRAAPSLVDLPPCYLQRQLRQPQPDRRPHRPSPMSLGVSLHASQLPAICSSHRAPSHAASNTPGSCPSTPADFDVAGDIPTPAQFPGHLLGSEM